MTPIQLTGNYEIYKQFTFSLLCIISVASFLRLTFLVGFILARAFYTWPDHVMM